jgi:D-alanyl-lipoteichoic acid acyltransferase DltB (MBOAT superfamily)
MAGDHAAGRLVAVLWPVGCARVALLMAVRWATGSCPAHRDKPGARAAGAKGWLAIAGNLGVLGWFKYAFARGAALAEHLGMPLVQALDVILPVGISFFTFQGLSYVIDVYNGRTRPARLLDLTLLMSFFPHLVAGPIVRPSHLLPQLRHAPAGPAGSGGLPAS